MNDNIIIKNGDCLKLIKNVPDGSVDLCILDLPYGQTALEWDTKIDISVLWPELLRISKENAAFIFFCTTKFGHSLITSQPNLFRYDLVWQKYKGVGFVHANKMPLRSHEMMYVFYKKLPTYNPQKTEGKKYYRGNVNLEGFRLYPNSNKKIIYTDKVKTYEGRFPVSIIKFPSITIGKKMLNPTSKPPLLYEWLIKTYSNPKDRVFDPCFGSGGIIQACINTDRKFIGFEKDPVQFKVSKKRYISK